MTEYAESTVLKMLGFTVAIVMAFVCGEIVGQTHVRRQAIDHGVGEYREGRMKWHWITPSKDAGDFIHETPAQIGRPETYQLQVGVKP